MAANTLDGLPVELKLCILQQMPNIQCIRTLSLASSKYYQAYTHFRSQVLYNLLCRQHNGEVEITEAVIAIRSDGVLAHDIRNQDKIFALLDCRRRGTKERKTRLRHDSFTIEEIVKMMKMHEAAECLMKDYAVTMPVPEWWDHKSQKWEPPIDFSHTERARFFRAFYRLQTWCYIFGRPEYRCSSSTPSSAPPFSRERDQPSENEWTNRTFTQEQAWRMIWGTMPPWEVEEVGCLLRYLMWKYVYIFQEVGIVLINCHHPDNSAEEENPESSSLTSSFRETSPPVGTQSLGSIGRLYGLRDPWSFTTTFRFSMIEIGPYFLYKILQQPFDERHVTISSNLRSVFTTEIVGATHLSEEQRVRLISPADKYEREDLATIISSWHVLDGPNQSWILHWTDSKGQIHPRLWLDREFSAYIPYPTINSSMWEWGYVLWDDERLDEWQAWSSFFI